MCRPRSRAARPGGQRFGSSSPVYVAGLLRREPRIALWPIDTTASRPDTEP
jgi:hypothetical protein